MPEEPVPVQVPKPSEERAGVLGCSLAPSLVLMVLVCGCHWSYWGSRQCFGPQRYSGQCDGKLGRGVNTPTFFLQKISHWKEC